MIEHFDTSEYPLEFRKRHDLLCVNRKVLDKMKDENGRKVLLELMPLTSMIYPL